MFERVSEDNAFPTKRVPWTYAWHVVMRGFTLDVSPLHDNYGTMTLTPKGVLALAEAGLFLWIPNARIRDKSKADFLAKGLVLCQITFLVIQLIARKVQHHPFTLLELHTAVHVVCALAMHTAWIGKPLDIKDPTSVDDIWGNPLNNVRLKW
jgi:hypothetical protein